MVGSILKRLAGLAGLMLAPAVMPQPAVMAQTITVTDLENRQCRR
jgi:hypothetical protein